LTEIQFHPKHGEGEWVELANRSGAAAELEGFTLRDRSGTRGALASAAACASDSLIVFAQDRDALLAAQAELDPARIVAVHPWPSLNNSDDMDGVADVLELRDAEGLPCDRPAYS